MNIRKHLGALVTAVLVAVLAISALVGCGIAYEVTFDPANGQAPTVVTVREGEVPTLPAAPVLDGHTFLGWYIGDVKYDGSAINGSVTLTARWSDRNYTVRFDTAGGTEAAPVTVGAGGTVSAPENVTREGYDLVGWYLGDEEYDFDAPVTGNLTLTARWQVRTYTVRFDTAGGTAAAPATVEHGSAVGAPENVTREGYRLVGWYLGDETYDFDTPVTGDLTLTARWEIRTFTVRFLGADGEELKSETVEWGKAATAPEPPAAPEGSLFAGWDKDFGRVTEDLTVTATYGKKISVTFVSETGETLAVVYAVKGSGVTAPALTAPGEQYELDGYYVDGVLYTLSTPVEGDLTVTVRWKIRTFTVTFDPAGGDARDPQTVGWGSAATKPEDPTRTYYRFGGWRLNGEEYDFSTPVTGNITLKAYWIVIRYRVTFDSDGGTTVNDVLANAGEPVTKPNNPTKTGYRFGGWYDAEGVAWNFDTVITGEITLTARWLDTTTAPEPTVEDIYLDPGTVEMWEGMTLKLAMAPIAVTGSKGAFTKLTAAGITMRFEVLDPDVATVDKDGNVTSVGEGETLVYAVFETGGTINNGKKDVTVAAGDISNAVTIRVVEKPAYLKAYEQDPDNQKITLGEVKGKDVNKYKYYPTGDYGAANIATWYGGANTVFTLTADDNLMGDFAQWLAWFEAYGIPTTLCAPTGYAYESSDLWNEMVVKGLDVQSHSRFHRSAGDYNSGKTSSAQDWMDFYGGVQDIESAGVRSLVIAYPCGYNNAELSKLLYIGGRGTGGYTNGFDVNYNQTASFSGLNEKQFAQLLTMADAGNGGWVSTHYHQIGGSKDSIDGMLARLVPYIKSGKLWSATFAAAAQYGQERDTATLTMGNVGRNAITFTLTDKMNDLLFDHALTIKIKVDSTWTAARAYQNGKEMNTRVVTDGGETYLFVDAIPDRGEVTVVRTELSGLTSGADRIAFTPTEAGDGYAEKTMTRRFYVTGDAWKNAYAVQNGRRIHAVTGNDGADLYVDVTFTVGGGEVIVVPTADRFDAAATVSMTDVFYGAVTPVAGKDITISTAEELRLFARWVNNNHDTAGLTFVLTDDIDLAGVRMESIGWYVLCNKSSTLRFDRSFRGTFDGQGHTVSNLTINHNGCSTGFFGSTDGAIIKNVKIRDAYIFGMRHTGGLVGRLVGSTVTNCTFTGTVSSRGKGAGQYSGTFVGGLVGEMSGSQILNCAAEAEILVFGAANRHEDNFGSIYENKYTPYCNGSYVGGIIGKTSDAASTVRNVSFNGKVTVVSDGADNGNAVGGFLGGGTFATITDCSATAEVSGGERVGGFVGSHEGTNQVLTIRNCVANGSVFGNDKVGGFAGYMGYNGRASSTNCFTNVRVTYKEGAEFVGAVIGQAYAGPQTPGMKQMYYLPSINPGLATHTPYQEGTVKVSVQILEAADAAEAMAKLNQLAATNGDQSWVASGDTITPVHYPIWRVVFVDKDGGEIAAYDVPNGMGIDAPAAPEYLGFRFTGWSAATDEVTSDMVVRALYDEVGTHTVVFLDKDGNELFRTTVNDGESVTPPAAPEYEGFRFTGWSHTTGNVTSDMTVSAQYEVVSVYDVTFVGMDGVTPIGATQRVNDGKGATAPEAPTVEGYVFTGWSVDFSEVHGDLTVVAQYAKLWKVRFYGYDDVLLATLSVQDGTGAKAPGVPSVDGYRFSGWAEDFSNVTADLDVHAVYVVKSTEPITVNVKHVTRATADLVSGDIVFVDDNSFNSVPPTLASEWGFVRERARRGTSAGTNYAILYNLSRYELAPGMTPFSIATTNSVNNNQLLLEHYVLNDALGLDTQAVAVPLLDKTSQRIVVAVLIYHGANSNTGTNDLNRMISAVMTELVAFYPEADAFVTSLHCMKSNANSGFKDVFSALDDTAPFVTGWDLTCINETAQADGKSTFYTMVYTQTGETGSVTNDAATVPSETNVTQGGYTVTVRVGKEEE